MPYTLKLDSGEALIADVAFAASAKAEPFRFAVSNRALFIPRKKFVAVSDPTFFEKVPFSSVKMVSRKRLKPYAWWVLAALMVLVGGVTTFVMMVPILHGEGGKVSGFPPAVAVVGLVIPFAIRGRYGLRVELVDGKFTWKPPIVVDRPSKDRIRNVQEEILKACEKAGVHVLGLKTPEAIT